MDLLGGGINAYPIGSYYFTSDARNPSEILGGGTWEKLEEGRFLMASGDGYPAGSKGGEATHTLTESEMPSHSHSGDAELSGSTYSGGSHSHSASFTNGSASSTGAHSHSYSVPSFTASSWGSNKHSAGDGGTASKTTGSAGAHSHNVSGTVTVNSNGSGQAHNNMPPYLSVYMWKRVA